MITSKQKEYSQEPLNELKNLLHNNPDLILGKIKKLFSLSSDSGKNLLSYEEYVKKGYIPILYSNHQSHADGLIISFIIEHIIKNLPPQSLNGFLCPIAASMESGDQDEAVQGGLEIFYKFLEQKGFTTIPVIREDDRKKYGMVGSNREVIERLLHAPRDKYGMVVFPEGRVQGGRMKNDGTIYGMQQVTEGGILLRCINFWYGQGKKSVLLPIGLINSYQLFSPDNYEISETILDMLTGEKEIKIYANIAIGEPIPIEQMQKDLGAPPHPKKQEHIEYLMNKIASLLPEEAKGYYRKSG
jgi:1-acyl-sn-glycerol-3-phosphate acyltransferase